MSSEKTNIIYTAEDIKKYLSGKLEPAEMHAMEKASLNDAFLAEAMEGYDGMQEKGWDKQLITLKTNFSKGQSAPVIALKPSKSGTMWKVAAAIFIICSGVALTYQLTNKKQSQVESIAAVNPNPDTVNSEIAEAREADTNIKTISPDISSNPKSSEADQTVIAKAGQKVLADSAFIYRPGTIDNTALKKDAGGGYVEDEPKNRNDYSTSNAILPAQEITIEQNEKINNNATRQVPVNAENLNNRNAAPTRRFSALVSAPDGAPLPFANISVTNENLGTYADAKGKFRLIAPDSLLNVQVKSVGYVSRNFTLRSDVPQNNIVLAEDELALKEKTIVIARKSLPLKKSKSILEPDSLIDVEPADGWDNYDTYINNNLSITNDILEKKIHGEVSITFDVQANGALTNVKIDKSLCDDCDKAALRLIKEGPRWKVKSGDKASGKIKVKF